MDAILPGNICLPSKKSADWKKAMLIDLLTFIPSNKLVLEYQPVNFGLLMIFDYMCHVAMLGITPVWRQICSHSDSATMDQV